MPPTVINALIDALKPLGVDHIDMPATPGRVWETTAREGGRSAAGELEAVGPADAPLTGRNGARARDHISLRARGARNIEQRRRHLAHQMEMIPRNRQVGRAG